MKKLLSILGLTFLSSFSIAQTMSEIVKAVAFDRSKGDRLGYAVGISGNYAIVGAYADDFGHVDNNRGSAYIFEKTGIEDWKFVQKIISSDQQDYDRFGYSVAIHGDLAVVGAYAEDEDELGLNTKSKAGSAYVFRRGIDGVWKEMQKIVASDRDVNDEFGWALDIYDSTIIVGAHHEGHDVLGLDFKYHAGSAYIFDLNGLGIWEQTQKIVPAHRSKDHHFPNGRPPKDADEEDLSDLFGGSVAIWGDYLVVGSHMHDYGAAGVGKAFLWNAGAAYVFERSGGVWTEVKKLLPDVRAEWDRYGHAVDIDSSVIVVGVWSEDENEFELSSLMNAGSAYIVERTELGDWVQVQKINASDRKTGDHFGKSVAINKNLLVIGAEQQDLSGDIGPGGTLSNAGAAYLYEKKLDGKWKQFQKITPSDRRSTDLFGEDVVISGTTVLVGGWQHDLNEFGLDSLKDAGAAYFFSSLRCVTEYVEQDLTICFGDSVVVGDSVYTVSGIYVNTLINADVCDSIVTTTLTVLEPINYSQTLSICYDHSVIVGTNEYSISGTYTDSLISEITFCDSIVTTYLTVETENLVEQVIVICLGDRVSVGESEYTVPGIYTDVLTSSTLCDSTVITTIEIDTYIDVTVSFPEVTTLIANEPSGAKTTFQWITCAPFKIIPGATSQTFNATENGAYAVIIKKDFCTDTSACMSITHVGIENNSELSGIQIYPNPANDYLMLTHALDLSEKLNVTIYNAIGAIIREEIVFNAQNKLDISTFPAGIYTLVIRHESGITARKFTKN